MKKNNPREKPIPGKQLSSREPIKRNHHARETQPLKEKKNRAERKTGHFEGVLEQTFSLIQL